jgi:hypothetical protein
MEEKKEYQMCYDCRFFSPGDFGCPQDYLEKELPKDWDEGLYGVCRLNPPRHGDMIKRGDDEQWQFYGEWPRVMAVDWCGQFQQRV